MLLRFRSHVVFTLVVLAAPNGSTFGEHAPVDVVQQSEPKCPTFLPDCDLEVIDHPELMMDIDTLIQTKVAPCGGAWDSIATRLTNLLYTMRIVTFDPDTTDYAGYWLTTVDSTVTIGMRNGAFDGAEVTDTADVLENLRHEGLHDHLWGDSLHADSMWNDACFSF